MGRSSAAAASRGDMASPASPPPHRPRAGRAANRAGRRPSGEQGATWARRVRGAAATTSRRTDEQRRWRRDSEQGMQRRRRPGHGAKAASRTRHGRGGSGARRQRREGGRASNDGGEQAVTGAEGQSGGNMHLASASLLSFRCWIMLWRIEEIRPSGVIVWLSPWLSLFIVLVEAPVILAHTDVQDTSWNGKPSNWVDNDPCGYKWVGVICTQNRVTSMLAPKTIKFWTVRGSLRGHSVFVRIAVHLLLPGMT